MSEQARPRLVKLVSDRAGHLRGQRTVKVWWCPEHAAVDLVRWDSGVPRQCCAYVSECGLLAFCGKPCEVVEMAESEGKP